MRLRLGLLPACQWLQMCEQTPECAKLLLACMQGNKKATIAEILNAEPVLPPFVSESAQHFIR
jgi:hypothetical protein